MTFPFLVTISHSRSKNGVASLAYDPVVHADVQLSMDCRIKSGNDDAEAPSCDPSRLADFVGEHLRVRELKHLAVVGWAERSEAHADFATRVGTARSLSSGRPLRAGPVGAFAHPP
jgi:hypothetical protein